MHYCCYCSVAQSCPTLWPHGLQHASLLCPSLSLKVCSHSCTESVMLSNHLILCHPLLLLPSIFGDQSIGASASASVLPVNIQSWFHLVTLWKWSEKLLSRVTPWTVAHQAPPSIEFFRQEYWSGLPFSSPGGSSRPGNWTRSPALWADALPSEPLGNYCLLEEKIVEASHY